ncbi:hypothetical protein [uncultured Acetobacteroides sp.]|uniref:hypothetical protein n=1 Tax=uncultured Acetobacteroides sp. TaxID=1760811 RepID=UPI0029F56A0F|nr:hypothetical protein [uncultured Acetobacteroides sp.]
MKACAAIFLVAVPLLFGCAKEERPLLPQTAVNITISLTDPSYTLLQNPSTAVKVSYYLARPVGYLGNGVIISNTGVGYNAFDATCTNQDHKSITIVDQIFGVCPVCNTRYNLLNGYAEGKGNLHLQSYRTMPSGNYLTVFN